MQTANVLSPSSRSEALLHPRFSGRVLQLAHAAWWLLLAVIVILTVVAIPLDLEFFRQVCTPPACQDNQLTVGQLNSLQQLGLSSGFYSIYYVALSLVVVLSYITVSVIIFRGKGNDGMAFLAAITLLLFGGVTFTDMPDRVYEAYALSWFPIHALGYLGSILMFTFIALFPNGRFVPHWLRWLLIVGSLQGLADSFLPPARPDWVSAVLNGFFLVFLVCAILAQVYRYRNVSTPSERLQTKWVVFGIVAALSSLIIFFVAFGFDSHLLDSVVTLITLQTFLYLSFTLIPISIGIAILRSRLWDIDLLINRTLVYGTLTAILAGVLAVTSDLTKRFFLAVTGESTELAPIVATLVVVAAFEPVKRRITSFVDQHFKYATGTLGAFGDELTKFVQLNDPEELLKRFLKEAASAFGAGSGAVYLGAGSHARLVSSFGRWDGHAELAAPLESSGTVVGLVALGARNNADAYDDRDRAQLDQMVALVARAIAVAQGTGHEVHGMPKLG